MRKSLFGGYPHNGIKSLEVFPNRVLTWIKGGRVEMNFDKHHFTFPDSLEEQKDWCMDRIHDYNSALNIAEQQILDMQAQYPFIPQSFGFEETDFIINPNGFSPTCYTKGKFMIANVEDSKWIITGINNGDGITIDLPNTDIAFVTLRALGVISDEQFDEPTDILVKNADVDVLGGEPIIVEKSGIKKAFEEVAFGGQFHNAVNESKTEEVRITDDGIKMEEKNGGE